MERVVHHVAEAEAGRLARRDVGAEGEIRGHEEVADKAHGVAYGVIHRQPEAALQEELHHIVHRVVYPRGHGPHDAEPDELHNLLSAGLSHGAAGVGPRCAASSHVSTSRIPA